jgi:integrase/recombinase XerD
VRDKTTRMQSPDVLERLGLQLMADTENRVGWPLLRRASRFRNGLIVALLARRPLRLKNFAAIAIGRHLVGREERYALLFPAGEMKNEQPYEVVIPDGLVGPLERYLTFWRGILLTRGGRQVAVTTDALWITREGAPMGEHAIYHQIVKLTGDTFGLPLNPHLFRSCAATAIAIAAPEQVYDVPALLGHADPLTAEQYYNQASALEAGRRYDALIDRYRLQHSGKRRANRVLAKSGRNIATREK